MSGQIRMTRQRAEIRDVMYKGSDFRTTQQVHDELRAAGSKVGLATVYRTLQSLAETGDLDAVRNPEGEIVYRRCSDGHHHHLICRNCGTAVEIEAHEFEEWADTVAKAHGFHDAGHELEVYGTCNDCWKAAQKS